MSFTIWGAKSSPTTRTKVSEIKRTEKNSPAILRASSLEAFNSFEKVGVKAELNAPSANILRRRLGILKATKKASVSPEAPKMEAMTMSLINPNILLVNIEAETIKDERKMLLDIRSSFLVFGKKKL